MKTRLILRVLSCCLIPLLVCACGGGGGGDDGGGGMTVTDLSGSLIVGDPLILGGSISTSDIQAPDGSYMDLYLVTPQGPYDLSVWMTSADVDAYLFFFTDDCIGLPLSEWWPCYLGEDDDTAGGSDAYLHFPGLTAGEGFIIAANTFGPSDFGTYTLDVLLEFPPQ